MAIITGTEQNDVLPGTSEADTISGLAGDDILIGGLGNDSLLGGAGNDFAIQNLSTDGADSVDLGDGNDVVQVVAAEAGQVRLSFTSAQVGNGNVNDSGDLPNQDGGLAVRMQLEAADGSPIGPVTRTDDEGISFLAASSGLTFDVRDLVSGVERGDQFGLVRLGTSASETIVAFQAGLATYINAGAGDDIVVGQSANDFLVGGAGNDAMNGQAGDDSFIGGAGNDTILGGLGTDTAIFNVAADGADTIDLGAGQDVVNVSGAARVRLTFTSAEVGNGNPNDSNTLPNQDGGLAVRMQAQDVETGLLVGDVSRTEDEGITFVAASGTTFDVRDLPTGIERGDFFEVVTLGTSADDTLIVSQPARPTYVNAGGGADTVIGGDANDFLVGGAGNDFLNGSDGEDTILGGAGNDSIDVLDRPSNIFAGNVAPKRDVVDAGDGDDDVLAGRLDQLVGGTGTDNLTINFGFNAQNPADVPAIAITVDATTGAGSASDGTTFSGFEFFNFNLTEQADAADVGNVRSNLSGEGGNDTLTAGSADDVISGGAGDDVISAGGGNNILFGGSGDDTIAAGDGNDSLTTDVAFGGADNVNLGGGQDEVRFDGQPGQIRVSFTSAEVGNGSATDGGTLPNQDGGLAVRIQGEADDGSLVGPVSRYDDEGITFVQGTQGITFDVRDITSGVQRGDFYESVVLGSSGADNLSFFPPFRSASPYYYNAGGGDDTVTAGTGNDFLVGGGGNDRLFGDAGNDTFLGGAGDDQLIGGLGDDSLDGGAGTDIVTIGANFGDIRYARGAAGATIVASADGRDLVVNHEGFVFDDLAIAFDPSRFGSTDTGASSPGGQLALLYDGLLGRAGDREGLEFFADALEAGASLESIATTFLSSPEYVARNGDPSQEGNEAFVAEIYAVALGHAPDAAGAAFWTAALENGVSRGSVAAQIAGSQENQGQIAGQLAAGVFVPNADASMAARLYLGLLDRAADADGLAFATTALEGGTTVEGLANTILNSPEYQSRFGGQSNAAFVDALYDNALGRDPDAEGNAFWVGQLDAGASRANVAASFTQGSEAQTYLAIPVEQGWITV